MPQQRDELGRFVAAADEAADRLRGFTRQVDESTRASANRDRQEREKEKDEGPGAVRKFVGGAALAGLGLGGGRIAGQVQAGGDFGDALNAILAGGIMALGKVPGIGNILGATQAGAVLERGGESVAGVTRDLARYGIDVSDEFRQGLVNTAVEQERRVENENQAIMAALGDPAVIGKAGGTSAVQAFGTFAEDIRELLNVVKSIAEAIKSWIPGAS